MTRRIVATASAHLCNAFRRPACWSACVAHLLSAATAAAAPLVFARIDAPPSALPPSIAPYAAMRGADGVEYVLALGDPDSLAALKHRCLALATNADPSEFVLVRTRDPSRLPTPACGDIVSGDGRTLVMRADGPQRAALAGEGFAIKPLPVAPPPGLRAATSQSAAAFNPVLFDPAIAEVVQQVAATNLHALVSQWSGVSPAVSGGELVAIATRYTTNQVATMRASLVARQRFEGLGLPAQFHHWSASGYSNRNVVATLPGGALSQEVIVVAAHLDSYAPAPRAIAPGADDNASGSAAVVIAADLLRRFRFDRTIRFILFTGEEQGLYGSDRYASAAASAGDNIVAVFNMDMIAWDSTGSPTLRLHTRTSGSAGYAADRAIAATFTNVVAIYGLSGSLSPIITADGESASDHSSFWDVGYPGILAIEDDYDDFHTFYHTTNDILSRLNLPYFTAFTKASIATVAHLAQPVARTHFDAVQVDNGDWVVGSGMGIGTFYARHEEGALEAGSGDARDVAWSAMATNPMGRWLRLHTAPDVAPLATDARPTNSESIFRGLLTAVSTGAAPFGCTNRLRFGHLAVLESNRAYTVLVRLDSRYTAGSTAFECATNLRSLVNAGGYLPLPMLANLTNGAVYGTLDIGSRLQSRDPALWPLSAVCGGGGMALQAPAQVGFPVVDTVEVSSNLLLGAAWSAVGAFTNDVPPTASNVEGGWETLGRTGVAGGQAASFRIRRRWLAP